MEMSEIELDGRGRVDIHAYPIIMYPVVKNVLDNSLHNRRETKKNSCHGYATRRSPFQRSLIT